MGQCVAVYDKVADSNMFVNMCSHLITTPLLFYSIFKNIPSLLQEHAYEELGLQKFFAGAMKCKKEYKTDAALVVAWSYTFGLANFKVVSMQSAYMASVDAQNFDRFLADFVKVYGPAGAAYPGDKELVKVIRQSAEEAGQDLSAVKSYKEKAKEGFQRAATVIRSKFRRSDFEASCELPVHKPRDCLATDPTELMSVLCNDKKTPEQRSRAAIESEYWVEVLTKQLMPTLVVNDMIEYVGGKKKAAKIHDAYIKKRWEDAATYDRESRRREYELKQAIGRQKFEAIHITVRIRVHGMRVCEF